MAETSAMLLERLNDRSDSVTWRRLVDLYSPLINAWLRRHGISADDAEDLTQASDLGYLTGVCLAVGGGLVFASGIALSVFREKLLALPDQIAHRKGVVSMLNWR
jgi:hypothetical protein